MRFLQFYTLESFSYFTDQMAKELTARGHEVFLYDLANAASLNQQSQQAFMEYCQKGLDAVVVHDGLGIHEDIYWKLWNKLGAVVVNILMDPPFRFHPDFESPNIEKYIVLSPDENHVEYIRKYFPQVKQVCFFPHFGTPARQELLIPYEKRKYNILFSGTYYAPDSYLEKIKQFCNATKSPALVYGIYMEADERMQHSPSLTVEQAIAESLKAGGIPDEAVTVSMKGFMPGADPLDWRVRMKYREKVVSALLEHGIDLCVVGRGWRNHPLANSSHLHILTEERIPIAETIDMMGDARINLNVMPWFKAGTHDRVFNAMLRKSVMLTDPSTYLERHFQNGESIAYYWLDELEKLPEIANNLLKHPEQAQVIAQKGYEIANMHFTWKECIDKLLEEIQRQQ